MSDAWSDSEVETSHRVRNRKKTLGRSGLRNRPRTTDTNINQSSLRPPALPFQIPVQIPAQNPVSSQSVSYITGTTLDQDRLIEILKTKIDIMRLSIEEAGRQYLLLHQRDQETISFLDSQVSELKEKLRHSANQVAVLSSTSSELKNHLNRLLDGLHSTYVGLESHKQEHDQQLQQLREIYVSETQAGIEKNTKISQLHATINDKNREIAVLRGWLARIKTDLRDSEQKLYSNRSN